MRNVPETSRRENQSKYFIFIVFSENRALRGARLQHKVASDRLQLTVQLDAEEMRVACWVTNARIQTRIRNI
jgi:hypothetical protein